MNSTSGSWLVGVLGIEGRYMTALEVGPLDAIQELDFSLISLLSVMIPLAGYGTIMNSFLLFTKSVTLQLLAQHRHYSQSITIQSPSQARHTSIFNHHCRHLVPLPPASLSRRTRRIRFVRRKGWDRPWFLRTGGSDWPVYAGTRSSGCSRQPSSGNSRSRAE